MELRGSEIVIVVIWGFVLGIRMIPLFFSLTSWGRREEQLQSISFFFFSFFSGQEKWHMSPPASFIWLEDRFKPGGRRPVIASTYGLL
jgi:hypothetical protein